MSWSELLTPERTKRRARSWRRIREDCYLMGEGGLLIQQNHFLSFRLVSSICLQEVRKNFKTNRSHLTWRTIIWSLFLIQPNLSFPKNGFDSARKVPHPPSYSTRVSVTALLFAPETPAATHPTPMQDSTKYRCCKRKSGEFPQKTVSY